MKWEQPVGAMAYPVAFSPDGGYVIVRCRGQAIQYYAARNGYVTYDIRSADGPRGGHWTSVAIAQNGQLLVIGAIDGEKNGYVEVFRTPNRDGTSVPAPAPASAPQSPSQQEKTSAKLQPVKPEPMSRF
ncbi:MAG: hypothetical protein ACYSWU_14935 [Planctomycetota bacterium]